MFNEIRITESVNRCLQVAGATALQYGYHQVGTEHLLYGICSIETSVASKILTNFKVTCNTLDMVFSRNSAKQQIAVLNNRIELTPNSKEVFIISKKFANQIGHNFIGLEHLLSAILMCDNCQAMNILKKSYRINTNDLRNHILQTIKAQSISTDMSRSAGYGEQRKANALPEKLLQMGTDLTQKARDGKIDPIIGRDDEIARVIEILCRKTKNNPVLIGEAGVGKSAIVDGLARAIVSNQVPEILRNKTIFSLELGGLMAGTKYRGELEERLKDLIDVIKNNPDIIVFIDEIHTLAQVGGDKGEVNPADMLKPYLARGEFQTVGATTTDEYRQFIEKDKALERRFQPVMVNPPSVEDTIAILRGLKDSFEAFHKVNITDAAIVAAATLSDRYIMDRSLPDKAIDLIDEASSRAKVHGVKKPDELIKVEDEIAEFEAEKKNALMSENFEKASEYRDKLNAAINRKSQIISNMQTSSGSGIEITEDDICDIIIKWTGIPVTKLTETEKDRLLKLESVLHKRVIGQDEAVTAVSKAIRRARIGLKDNNRPIGSFMFLGQTGVGKTELCKALAEAMFDNENSVIRIDMSEYMEKHSISKLIGSPPGYVGFDDGGQLTEAVRRKPYSVVLFDEIEKAHPDVYNLLLQVLDDGRLTDSQGRTVSFKNTIIIFTSNVGVSELKHRNRLGFSDETEKAQEYEQMKEVLLGALKRNFKPEFLNRIDVITVFHSLSFEQLAQIAKIFISNLNKKLVNQGVSLRVTESALKYLIDKGYDPEYGARPLRRLIEQEVEDRIAEYILEGKVTAGNVVTISAKEGRLTLNINK